MEWIFSLKTHLTMRWDIDHSREGSPPPLSSSLGFSELPECQDPAAQVTVPAQIYN